MLSCDKTAFSGGRRAAHFRLRGPLLAGMAAIGLIAAAAAQSSEGEKPVPVLSGVAGYFNFIAAGQNQIDEQVNPVLLLPLGERWLAEARMECEGAFQRPPGGGPYQGGQSKNLDYAEADFIANRYVTVTMGRFLTPFGIFNERLYPIWIRSIQQDPLILPLSAESNDGLMLRGGFAANASANLSYAVYASAIDTGHNNLQSNRDVGGRVGVFFPGLRIEIGASWQRLLQDTRTNNERQHMNRELAHKAMHRLNPALRRAFLLHKAQGWTHQEVAEELGITQATAKTRVFRARRQLRQELAFLTR